MEFGRYEVAHDYFGGFRQLHCIFDGRCKLTVDFLSSDKLYDLEKDPQEMGNLIEKEKYAENRDCLYDRLLIWMDETRDPMRGHCFCCGPRRTGTAPKSWNDSGMTRQKEPDYDESGELCHIDVLPVCPSSYRVISLSAK